MSNPTNNYVSGSDSITAPKAAAQAVNQGDFVKVSSNLIVPVAAATDVPIGVARDTSPVVSLLDQLTQVGVIRAGAIVYQYLKAGDTANFGDALYLEGSDPQVVTTSSGGGATKVGYCREQAALLGAAANVTRVQLELAPQAN